MERITKQEYQEQNSIQSSLSSIKKLKCTCCGSYTRGRQWWNRDTGYGICNGCAMEQKLTEDADEMKDNYGIERIHYNL